MQQPRRSRGPSAGRPIADWLSGLERSNTLASHAEMILRLQAIYARCVPPGMAVASELANVRDGVAVVIAHSGAVAHRLRMLAPSLILALRKGGATVSELKVLAQAPPPGPEPRAKHALPSQAALDSVQALVAELEPSPLRSALEAMAARQKRDLRSRG
jgi:hypothetical protein